MESQEILTKDVPYAHLERDFTIFAALFQKEIPPTPKDLDDWEETDKWLWQLCRACWDIDAARRPTAEKLIQDLDSVAMEELERLWKELQESQEREKKLDERKEQLEELGKDQLRQEEEFNSKVSLRQHEFTTLERRLEQEIRRRLEAEEAEMKGQKQLDELTELLSKKEENERRAVDESTRIQQELEQRERAERKFRLELEELLAQRQMGKREHKAECGEREGEKRERTEGFSKEEETRNATEKLQQTGEGYSLSFVEPDVGTREHAGGTSFTSAFSPGLSSLSLRHFNRQYSESDANNQKISPSSVLAPSPAPDWGRADTSKPFSSLPPAESMPGDDTARKEQVTTGVQNSSDTLQPSSTSGPDAGSSSGSYEQPSQSILSDWLRVQEELISKHRAQNELQKGKHNYRVTDQSSRIRGGQPSSVERDR